MCTLLACILPENIKKISKKKTVWQLEQPKEGKRERKERILNYEYKSLLFLETTIIMQNMIGTK